MDFKSAFNAHVNLSQIFARQGLLVDIEEDNQSKLLVHQR